MSRDAADLDAWPAAAPGAAQDKLDEAILVALQGLLPAFELEPLGDDRFRAAGEPAHFDRVFGGQLIAQALLGAGATVGASTPHSMHAYFVSAGAAGQPVELAVERVRDGRSIATRKVTVLQDGRPLLIAMASFQAEREASPEGPLEFADPSPDAPPPDQVRVLQDWVPELPPERQRYGRAWVEQPPPLELRIAEPPNFMGGPNVQGPRSHWMRLPREVGADPLLHTAVLAYASDYLLLDMMLRTLPEQSALTSFTGASLDHALWFHRPVRMDRWHLHTQQAQAISGDLGLVRGAIHDADGHLVASVMQEVLVRPAR